MFQVRARCGHCSQKNPLRFRKVISFHPLLDRPDPNQPRPRGITDERRLLQQQEESIEGDAAALAVCCNCGRPSLVIFRSGFKHFKSLADNLDNERAFVDAENLVEVVKILPEPPRPVILEGWPEEIIAQFADIQYMLYEGKHPALIIGPCRAVLDIVTRRLGGKAKRLVDRIDELLEKNVITRPLADWAHALRLDGNQAAHDLHGTRAEAEQYVAFLRMFMELTFSLPERIKRVRDGNPPQDASNGV